MSLREKIMRKKKYSVSPKSENPSKSQGNTISKKTADRTRAFRNEEYRRGAFVFSSFRKNVGGSLTLEAMMGLPLLIFVFFMLCGFFSVINIEAKVKTAINETAGDVAHYYYAVDQLKNDLTAEKEVVSEMGKSIPWELLNFAVTETEVRKKLQNQTLFDKWIKGGASGISLLGSYYDTEKNEAVIRASYTVKLPFFSIFSGGISLSDTVYRRAWIGKTAEKTEECEEYVYITETGTVYHKSPACTHLKLSIRRENRDGIPDLRNESGGKYVPCEYCGNEETETVYITDYGTCYHSNRNCSGLKRSIRRIRLSEIGTRDLCQRCGEGT